MAEVLLLHHAQGLTPGVKRFADELRSAGHTVHTPDYYDGKVFDDSPWKTGQPASFALTGVIPGFAQGILGMHIGGRRELVIPPALGYGPAGSGPVGANETLVFVIDLVGVQ